MQGFFGILTRVGMGALALAMLVCAMPARAGQEASPQRTLAEFETRAHYSPEVLAAVAALDESLGRLDLAQADGGWRFFGGAGAGQFREQADIETMRSYERVDLRAGLKYPLFGSKHREEESVLKMQALSEAKTHEQALAGRDSLLALRLHYINYWAAQEKRQLAELFLRDEAPMEQILSQRTAAGHLLEGDRRDYLSAYALVRRHQAQAQALQQRALGVLTLMTAETVPAFQALFPEMARPCLEADALAAAVQTGHPLVLSRRQAVADQRQLAELAQKSGVNGQVALYSNLNAETDAPEPGYGVGVDFSFDFPLRSRQAGTARRQAALAALEQSRRQLEIVQAQLLMEARQTLDDYRTAEKNYDFALQRLGATREQLREKLLRSVYLPGDGLEQAQQSRLAEYQAAMELVEAWVQRLQTQARLLHLAPSEAWSAAAPAAPAQPGYTVYVWHSAELLARAAQPATLLADLRRRRIERLLLSFNAEQMAALAGPDDRRRWVALLGLLQKQGLRVELLLGEPLWILEAHRPRLLALIRDLADFPLSAIHLDLEPDQIPSHAEGREDLWPQLLETVREVKAQTKLPVGLSVHSRYLDPQRPDGGWGPRLAALGVDEVVLMIYVSDPQRAAAIAGPILRGLPGLDFSIAQSLEPVLSAAESHADQTCPQLEARLARLRGLLPEANVKGIVLQSWKEYEGLCP
jgi:outer membrane protein TolC